METDLLLVLISAEDRRHEETKRLLDKFHGDIKISPYSLIEFDLLLKSGEIVVKEIPTFYDVLNELFEYADIVTFPTKPNYHNEAFKLRKKYGNLTYFDGLHAAVGIVENLELVSYDKEYTKITELKHKHPAQYA